MQLSKALFSAIVGLVIVISLVSGFGLANITSRTSTSTTVSVTTSTIFETMSQTVIQRINESTGARFELIFNQTGICNQDWWVWTWSVNLSNGEFISEPPNFSGCCGETPPPVMPIVFSLPPGNYSYHVKGRGIVLAPVNGTVSITDEDVVVQLYQPYVASCGPVYTNETNP